MPKRKRQRAHARAAALRRWQSSEPPSASQDDAQEPLLSVPESCDEAASSSSTDQELSHSESDSDPDFDPEEALRSDPEALLEEFVVDWVSSLPREDLYSLSLLLFHILKQDFQLLIGPASKIIASHLKKSHKTIQKWRVDFLKNEGELPEFLRGKYHRTNAIAKNEELTEQAILYVRENAFKKGAPNLTARSFCSWVNDELLPNSTLEAGAPRRISVEVARRWLHEMGFKVRRITKGIYYDGHERADVVEDRKTFLKEVSALGFLHASNAPNEEAASLLEGVSLNPNWNNTIFWFHDESTFNSNDDQTTMWKDDTMQIIKPKGRGAGLMVLDFIEERDGYCALSDAVFQAVHNVDPSIEQSARVIFEYGKGKEGYWNNELFMEQIDRAAKVAEAKYPLRILSMC